MDATLFSRTLGVVGVSWPGMAIGTAITLATAFLGWTIGRYRWFPFVRWIGLWVRVVVLPLIRSRSWLGRAAAIFVNNISILTGLIAVGIWPVAALSAAAMLGVSLGIALRVLMTVEDVFTLPDGRAAGGAGWRMKVGVALNMLEPPAIAVALGLSLGRWMVPLSPGDAWETFAVWVVPAMLLAAGGESLWLGVRPERARQPLDSPPSIDS